MAQEIGIAKVVQGQMTATGPSGSHPLHQGSPVFKGDTVVTAKGSAGAIEFLDHTVLNVGEGSKVSLDQYVFDADKGTGKALFKLAQGTFRTVTGEIVKHNPESFKMQSPLATIGIRGTETAHTIPGPGGGDENHLVMVFDGKPVIVQPLGGGAFQVLSQAGVKVEVGKFGAGPVMVMTPQEFKYFQALTETGIQQGAPTDTISTSGQSQVKNAQDAAAKATADAAAKSAAEAAAKAAAEAAAKAAAEAAKGADPAAKAAAEAAAKAAADAAAKAALAAKAAAELAAKAAADAAAALQAQALAEAAAKAAADLAAQQFGQQGPQGQPLGTPLNLTQGTIITLNQITNLIGSGNLPGTGTGTGTGTTVISQAAQDLLNQLNTIITEQQNYDTNITQDNSLSLAAKSEGQFVDLDPSDQNTNVVSLRDSAYYESNGNHVNWIESSYSNAFEAGVTAISSAVVNVTGSNYGDQIYGSNSANALYGADGSDLIYGRGGADLIEGGEGNDTIYGGADNDTIDGGSDYDNINGDAGNDVLSGGDGNDTVMGGIDNDIISGGAGNDMLNGEDGKDTIDGGAGDDTIIGGIDNDVLTAGDGTDSVQGGMGDDLIYLGTYLTASDTVDGGPGNDALYYTDNGLGTDELSHVTGVESIILGDAATAITVDQTLAAALVGSTTSTSYISISAAALSSGNSLTFDASTVTGSYAFYVTGGAGADVIKGSGASDSLSGGAGNDTIAPGMGNDTLYGGLGADTLDYSTFVNDYPLTIGGAAGQTGSTTFSGYTQYFYEFEVIKAGQGADTIDLHLWTNAATVYGNEYSDTIYGGTGNDYLDGGTGNDVLHGNAGNDTIYGGDGDDTLNGGAGNNALHGDAGTDMVSYGNATGAVTANLSTGSVTANGYGGTDTLENIEQYYGSSHGDTVYAGSTTTSIVLGSGDDTVYMSTHLSSGDTVTGGSGNDTLHLDNSSGLSTDLNNVSGFEHIILEGASANLAAVTNLFSNVNNVGLSPAVYVDGSALTGTLTFDGSATSAGYLYITGSSGNDSLVGGNNTGGGDHLYGSGGADTMTGGAGPDLFIYHAKSEGGDTITDFTSGSDKFAFLKSDAGGDFGYNSTATAQGHVFNTLTDYMNAADPNAACWVRDDDFNILKFDDDGYAGAHAAVTIANNVSNITSTDIIIVNSSHVEV